MINIQKKAEDFFGSSCYAMCISYLFDPASRNNTIALWENCLKGLKYKAIQDNGYVISPLSYVRLISNEKPKDVTKVSIKSLDDLPAEGLYAVEYQYKGSHFVVAKKGAVVFDPYGDSNSVKFGKPVSFRLYKF